MTDGQRIDEAIKHIETPVPPEDPRPFWARLLSSIRVSFKPRLSGGKPQVDVTVKGGADF